jgi:hypothetical protein
VGSSPTLGTRASTSGILWNAGILETIMRMKRDGYPDSTVRTGEAVDNRKSCIHASWDSSMLGFWRLNITRWYGTDFS